MASEEYRQKERLKNLVEELTEAVKSLELCKEAEDYVDMEIPEYSPSMSGTLCKRLADEICCGNLVISIAKDIDKLEFKRYLKGRGIPIKEFSLTWLAELMVDFDNMVWDIKEHITIIEQEPGCFRCSYKEGSGDPAECFSCIYAENKEDALEQFIAVAKKVRNIGDVRRC